MGDAFEVGPVTLVGEHVRLEPLRAEHAEGLERARDEGTFRYFYTPPPTTGVEGMRAWIDRLNAERDRVAFCVMDAMGGVLGSTSYLHIRAGNRGLEIGSTFIARAHRGSAVNPEMKLLLLEHAFERLGAIRVELRTDARNAQSRRAIEKLGATFEGILRRHCVMPDGFLRDTVVYAILDTEWESVRDGLLRRLGRSQEIAAGTPEKSR